MQTEDYKELLLKYITGKIDESGTSPQTIVNLDRKQVDINIKQQISLRLTEEKGATSAGTYILGKIYGDQYENFLIYGNYSTGTNTYGYVCIVNRNLEIVSLLTEYNSGTLIYPLISIRQSETGQFYGLTYGTNGTDTDYRVVLFNNILSSGIADNNYQVIMRQTYIMPNSSSYRASLYRENRIVKSLDSPIYYITLHNTNNVTVIIKFTIKGQEENTWEVFETEYLMDTVQFDVLLDKSSGEEIFYFYGIDIMSNNSYDIYRSYQLQDIITPLNTINLSGTTSTFLTQVFARNKDEIYLSISINQTTTLYKVNNTSLTSLYTFNWASSNSSYLYLEETNGIVFYKQRNSGTETATITVGLLVNDTIQSYDSETTLQTTLSLYDYNDLYIFVQYNLINIYIPYLNSPDGTYILVADYNPNNYNGLPYENINALMAVKGRIINTDLQFVFARNLYNKYIKNNVTVSTIEIPNTLLNNENLFYIGIIGATNYYLFDNGASQQSDPITKNIYETLDINFYNTLTMIDDNNIYNPVENINGASRINESTSAILDYHNAQATKAKVMFTDLTYNIITIDPSTQITITNNIANYDFVIYVPSNKTVDYMQIISYDETTEYAIINGNFISGDFNRIQQKVSIN